jgi:hypothetical protein
MDVMAVRDLEEAHDDRNQQQHDPRPFERLGHCHDHQDDAGDQRAKAVDRRTGLPSWLLRSRQWITIPVCDSVKETNTPIM